MVLPGVSRSKRISFVEEFICTLIEDGLDGITESELENLKESINKFMASVITVSEESGNEEETEKPGGC